MQHQEGLHTDEAEPVRNLRWSCSAFVAWMHGDSCIVPWDASPVELERSSTACMTLASLTRRLANDSMEYLARRYECWCTGEIVMYGGRTSSHQACLQQLPNISAFVLPACRPAPNNAYIGIAPRHSTRNGDYGIVFSNNHNCRTTWKIVCR
jgi:hypothetical protein